MDAKLTLTGAVVDGPVFGTALDVIAGVVDGAVDVSTTGYSPAALFAGLRGPVRVSLRNGALAGFDAGELLTVLQGVPANGAGAPDNAPLRADAARALAHGATPVSTLDLTGTLAGGQLTLERAAAASPSAAIGAAGELDLPGGTMDLSVTLQPKLEGVPAIGLRLIGPVDSPSRSTRFAELTQWLAAH